MESSVSVLFPVHNAQATLQADISRVLEILPELTSRFDLLIIDDGSTDATVEVAHELALRYPQVNLIRQKDRQGLAEALRCGFNRTLGEMILVHDAQGGVEADELPRLWNRRHDPAGIVLATDVAKPATRSPSWFKRWLPTPQREAMRPVKRPSGFHLLQRRTLRQMQAAGPKSRSSLNSGNTTGQGTAPRVDGSIPVGETKRPSFLQKVREFAIGE